MVALVQPSLSSGEISPKLHARVDLARYQTALKFLRNCMVLPEGGVTNRAGTRFVNALTGPSVLIPFIYSTTQTYMLVFAAGSILVFANGGYVQSTSTITISNVTISPIAPYEMTVTTLTPHGLVLDQPITIAGVVGTGDYNINGNAFVGTVLSPTTFKLPRLAVPPSGSYTSGGTITASVSITNPYAAEDLEELRFAQSNDVLTIAHKDYPLYEFRRLSSTSFTFTPAVFEDGPFIDLNTDESVMVHASARIGTVTLNATGNIFNANHVGGLFYLEQRNLAEVPPWEPNKKLVENPASTLNLRRRSDGKTYRCVTDYTPAAAKEAWTGTVRPTHSRGVQSDGDGSALNGATLVTRAGVAWEYRDSGFGIVRITAYTSQTQVTALVLRALPDACVGGRTTSAGPYGGVGDGVTVSYAAAGATEPNKAMWEVTLDGVLVSPDDYEVDINANTVTFYTAPALGVVVVIYQLSANNRSDVWAFGAWSEDQGYPSVVTYWQDRFVTAASIARPKTVWGSKSGEYPDFGVSVPIVDDDAVDFTLNARQQNAITDLLPLDSLIALTSAGAWKVTDGQNEVLTPTTVGFKPQHYRGADNKRAIIIGDEAIYPQFAGTKLRTLGYTLDSDKFTGINLTALAEHLFSRSKTVRDMDYAAEPHAQLWVTRSDGRLISLTYDKEQQVIGFGRHDTRGGYFERVCDIPEGGVDAVYFIVRRVIGGVTRYYLERLADRDFEDIVDAVFHDCAISYDGRNTTATTMRLTGLGWTVDDYLTLTASTAQFAASHVNDEVWIYIDTETQDERGEPTTERQTVRVRITGYTSSMVVTVQPLADVPAAFQATAFTNWTFAHDSFSGATHLEGLECGVMADGEYRGTVTVTGGAFSISPPGGVVHLGIPKIDEGETLDINLVGQETVRHRAKGVPNVFLDVLDTRGVKAGPDRDNLEDVAERSQANYDVQGLVTGVLPYRIPTKQGSEGSIVFRQDLPLPMTIRAIIPDVEVGEAG